MQAIATARAEQQVAPCGLAQEYHVTPHPIDQEIQSARRIPSVRAIVIPPCPESLRRLQDILAQSELDAGALDQLASSDVAMAAALIRQANSPLHGLAQPVQTVGMALTVLGLHPSAELLSAFITRHALQVRSPLLEHFWESSQRRAMACEHMGHQLYSFDPGLGYSFGLFCHVGMPVLVKAVRGYGSTVTPTPSGMAVMVPLLWPRIESAICRASSRVAAQRMCRSSTIWRGAAVTIITL